MGLNRLATRLGPLELRSPLLTASGTSGSSNEIESLAHHRRILGALGAFVTKGVTLEPRRGNPLIRVIETRTGLLNSIGLQNKGARAFLAEELPRLVSYRIPVIVNISAGSVDEFARLAGVLLKKTGARNIAGLEINVSCPNIKKGGAAFGSDPRMVERVVKAVRQAAGPRILIITKLSPNVTDITLPARAAIAAGTDALSLINTLRAMAINIHTGKPALGNAVGGLSGPAIKPVGVFMVHQCFSRIPECRRQQIPLIGLGGISNWKDAIEYVMAGASAVAVGTAWFVNTNVFTEIHDGLSRFLAARKTTLSRLVGAAHQ